MNRHTVPAPADSHQQAALPADSWWRHRVTAHSVEPSMTACLKRCL